MAQSPCCLLLFPPPPPCRGLPQKKHGGNDLMLMTCSQFASLNDTVTEQVQMKLVSFLVSWGGKRFPQDISQLAPSQSEWSVGRKIKISTLLVSHGFTQNLHLSPSALLHYKHTAVWSAWSSYKGKWCAKATSRHASLTQPDRKWFPLWMHRHHATAWMM